MYIDNGSKEVETGFHLGEMTNELYGDHISNFVSSGPKSYSFLYNSNQQEKTVKGFTLNYQNGILLNHDSLKKVKVVNEHKIARKKNEGIVNKYHEKIFKLGYDKRVVKKISEKNICTVPYEYM